MLALLMALQLGLPPNNVTGFAEDLMRQRDYYRAITEFKRAAYYTSSESLKVQCMIRIATAYRRSGKFQSSAEYSLALLQDQELRGSDRRRCNLNLGMTYLMDHKPWLGLPYLQAAERVDSSGLATLCLGWTELELRRPDRAGAYFSRVAASAGDSRIRTLAGDLESSTRRLERAPRRSPFLATALSAVVPGAGQLYSGHDYDALQAFLFTTASAFSTYAMYRYEDKFNHRLVLTYVGISFSALFYAANLLGANHTAKYRNWKIEQDLSEEARSKILSLSP